MGRAAIILTHAGEPAMLLRLLVLTCLGATWACGVIAQADEPQATLDQAVLAWRQGKIDQALEQLDGIIKASPQTWQPYYVRGLIHAGQRSYLQAYRDFSSAIEREPNQAALYDQRGSVAFCQGNIEQSIRDFDRAIELDPARERGHWKRGISYYYAGEYAKGQKQFEAYQTYDDSDVENAVWRFLCMVPQVGLKKAQQEMLRVGPDRRVPMREIYELYAGRLEPDEVLKAARAGAPDEQTLHHRLFYAHLYLGLYYEVIGKPEQARREIEAADARKIGHYMWDVAHVHAQRMKAAAKAKDDQASP